VLVKKRMVVRLMALAGLMASGLTAVAHAPVTLQEAFQGDFLIGAAMDTAQITGQDARGDNLLEAQFNSISPENALKWEIVHPQPG